MMNIRGKIEVCNFFFCKASIEYNMANVVFDFVGIKCTK